MTNRIWPLALFMVCLSSHAELRKCNHYEIMNDQDGDGLVQNQAGQSICYYLQSDTGRADLFGGSSINAESLRPVEAEEAGQLAEPLPDSEPPGNLRPH